MKLVTFSVDSMLGPQRRVGVMSALDIFDVTSARCRFMEQFVPPVAAAAIGMAQTPPDLAEILALGETGMQWLSEAVGFVAERGLASTALGVRISHRTDDVVLLAPIPAPPAMFNFNFWPGHRDSTARHGMSMPAPQDGVHLGSFWKGNAASFVGPGISLRIPSYAEEIDVECELAAIIGVGGRDLDVAQAERAIAGYTIFNDASVRSVQPAEMRQGRGMCKAKDFDTGNAMGPCLVTPDEVGSIHELEFSLEVNGQIWSSARGVDIRGNLPEVISFLSRGQTLLPGTVVATGAFAGGTAFDLGRRLSPGDEVGLHISRIGVLRNVIGAHEQPYVPLAMPR